LVPPGDETALAAALLECLQNRPLQERLRSRGPDQAQAFDISDVIGHYALLLKKMKVLFVVPTMRAGGVERCTAILLRYFDRDLYDMGLVLIHYHKPFYRWPSDIKTYVLAHEPWLLPYDHLTQLFPHMASKHQNSFAWLEVTARNLGKIIRQQQPDAVIAQDFFASIITLLAKRFVPNQSKVLCSIHNHYSNLLPTSQHGDLHAAIMQRCLNEADHIVAVSHGVVEDLVHHFGTRRDLISVIHNPIDLGEVTELAEAQITEHAWFNEKVPIFLFVGRLTTQKGLQYLLQAVALARQSAEFRCALIGEGEQRQELEALARQLKITDVIRFLGRQNNPFKFMKRATAFVLPSVMEGLPYVLSEALACGCPIIATDCSPGVRELLADGKCGLLVPPKNSGALAEAILYVLRDTDLRAKLIEEGLRQVEQFAAEKIVSQYEALVKAHVGITFQ
jgi:glycosyltransferase involved in cell wall biosynthesis